LEDSLPKAALHSLTGAGHMLMLEKPAETAALVEKVAKGLISKD
jgi:pimeloyl-ACP methyl ester carboxylesterase